MDAAGNAYVSGYTCSANFPVVSDFFLTKTVGCDGAFAVQWDPTGFAAYSTLLGQGFGFHPYAIAIDAARSAYVAGWTGSTGLPVVGAVQPVYGTNGDAFVMKIKQ